MTVIEEQVALPNVGTGTTSANIAAYPKPFRIPAGGELKKFKSGQLVPMALVAPPSVKRKKKKAPMLVRIEELIEWKTTKIGDDLWMDKETGVKGRWRIAANKPVFFPIDKDEEPIGLPAHIHAKGLAAKAANLAKEIKNLPKEPEKEAAPKEEPKAVAPTSAGEPLKAPEPPKAPKAPEALKPPKPPTAPKSAEGPAVPTVPGVPKAKKPEPQGASEVPSAPKASETPNLLKVPKAPKEKAEPKEKAGKGEPADKAVAKRLADIQDKIDDIRDTAKEVMKKSGLITNHHIKKMLRAMDTNDPVAFAAAVEKLAKHADRIRGVESKSKKTKKKAEHKPASKPKETTAAETPATTPAPDRKPEPEGEKKGSAIQRMLAKMRARAKKSSEKRAAA